MAVLMPIMAPEESMSGPPEFPGFVWSRGFWSFLFLSFESFSFFFQKNILSLSLSLFFSPLSSSSYLG